MLVRLQLGSIQALPIDAKEGLKQLDRPAMLVYEGEFESMDGPITVTAEHIQSLAEAHNAQLSKVKRLSNGDLPPNRCPPIQLDHTSSARDTVGRLVSELNVGTFQNEEGEEVSALFGTLRFLGQENCERVQDGRWTDLSIGADFENSILSEITVTPFPAAKGSALLSSKKRSVKHLGQKQIEGVDVNFVEVTQNNGKKCWESSWKDSRGRVLADKNEESLVVLERLMAKAIKKDKRLSATRIEAFPFPGKEVEIHQKDDGKFFGRMYIGQSVSDTEDRNTIEEVKLDLREILEKLDNPLENPMQNNVDPNQIGPDGVRLASLDPQKQKALDAFKKQFEKLEKDYKEEAASEDPNREYMRDLARRMQEVGRDIASIQKGGKLGAEPNDKNKLAEGETMNRAEWKKYLMEVKGMTEEEAEAYIEEHKDDEDAYKEFSESEEGKTRLAKKEDDDEDEEEKKKDKAKAKLTAAKKEIAKLSTTFKANVDAARLAAAKGRILTRLSKLRSQAKITPAEVKKLDLTQLSKATPEAIDMVLKTYEDREPVIVTGQFGSIKAESFARLGKQQQMTQLEAETRRNMSLKRGKTPGNTKLSEGDVVVGTDGVDVSSIGDHTIGTEEVKQAYENLIALLDQGNIEEVKAKLKSLVASALAIGGSSEYTESNTLETETQLSALAESVTKMQTQYDHLHKLAGSLVE